MYLGKKAVVVGAGPAGSTAAMYLARQGFKVDVFEKRPEPNSDLVDTGRAYIIILIPRGRAALEEIGVDLPTDPHYLTQGTVRHSNKGKVSFTKEEGNITWSRADLAQYLIDQAKQKYPGQISFFFEKEVEGVDMKNKQVSFVSTARVNIASLSMPSDDEDSASTKVPYDLLVAADGAASKVRNLLLERVPGFTVDVSDSGREYKVYMNLQGDIEPPEFKGNPGATLHLWSALNDPFMSFTAHRNPDGTYSGTFSMRSGDHANVTSAAGYETILRTRFAGIPEEWVKPVADQAWKGQASPAGKRIRCSTLGVQDASVVLLGDAAHAVTPVFGQGANSSLESCQVLGEALKACEGDLSKVPATFDEMRRPDVHGLYEIDRKAFRCACVCVYVCAEHT